MVPCDPRSKGKPTHPLGEVRRLIEDGCFDMVGSAKDDARSLGFSVTEAIEVVAGLERCHFRVSRACERIKGHWQDAYGPSCRGIDLYIKFKIIERGGKPFLLVLSFHLPEKERL